MPNNRKIIMIVAVAILIALAAFITITSSPSGSKVGSTPSPTPGPGVQYSGTDALIRQGVSSNNLENLKFAIFKFNRDAKTVTIANADHAHSMAPDGAAIDSVAFDITIDQTTYKGDLLSVGLESAKLTLKDPKTKTLVYDSGVVKVDRK